LSEKYNLSSLNIVTANNLKKTYHSIHITHFQKAGLIDLNDTIAWPPVVLEAVRGELGGSSYPPPEHVSNYINSVYYSLRQQFFNILLPSLRQQFFNILLPSFCRQSESHWRIGQWLWLDQPNM